MNNLTPGQENAPEGMRKFGDEVRLKTLLSNDFNIETRGVEEWNQIDIWRMQHQQLMHELTWLGISQTGSSLHPEMVVADSNDRTDLQASLLNVVVQNRFKPSHGLEIYHDRNEIERKSGVLIGKSFWTMREPLVAHWQGEYQSDAARLELLVQLLLEEKKEKNEWPLEDRMWYWAEMYFAGCCPQEIEVPKNQDAQAVLKIFQADVSRLLALNITSEEKSDIQKNLRISFLRGEYPIVLGSEEEAEEEQEGWSDDEPMLQHTLEEIVESATPEMRPFYLTQLMTRYSRCCAQGLDFLEEEEKYQAQRMRDETILLKEIELRKQNLSIEVEYLNGLSLPPSEAEEWSNFLERNGDLPLFKPNEKHRTFVHDYIRWMIENMATDKFGHQDIWSILTPLIYDYWGGKFHPDNLRWKILNDECSMLTSAKEKSPTGSTVSRFILHDKFAKGSVTKAAAENCDQDPESLLMAYESDMQLIDSLNLLPDETRRAKWAYNKWVLEGKLPINVDREVPGDRQLLEKNIRLYVDEITTLEQGIDSIMILQLFCDHWNALSKRPVTRKEK